MSAAAKPAMTPVPKYDFYSDTHPKALEVFLDLQRKMPVALKVRRVFEMNDMLFRVQQGNVRSRYPDADEREVFLRVTARRLDRETMKRVYNWDPAE